MTQAEFSVQLITDFGSSLETWEELPSTNLRAKEWAQAGAPHGSCVLAKRQSQGRGRLGRSFFSPEGGLYLSLILRPTSASGNPLLITSLAAVAAARALEALTPLSVGIKWVNDLVIGGKKLAGILAESGFEGETLQYIILGIGINLAPREFPEELASIATTVANECGVLLEPLPLAARFLNEFGTAYQNLPDTGFLSESRSRSTILGQSITVYRAGVPSSARALDLSPDGGLVIEENGTIQTLTTGEISVRLEGQAVPVWKTN